MTRQTIKHMGAHRLVFCYLNITASYTWRRFACARNNRLQINKEMPKERKIQIHAFYAFTYTFSPFRSSFVQRFDRVVFFYFACSTTIKCIYGHLFDCGKNAWFVWRIFTSNGISIVKIPLFCCAHTQAAFVKSRKSIWTCLIHHFVLHTQTQKSNCFHFQFEIVNFIKKANSFWIAIGNATVNIRETKANLFSWK